MFVFILDTLTLKDGSRCWQLLRSIEALAERQQAGEELDEQQQQKVARLDDVIAEMEALMAGG